MTAFITQNHLHIDRAAIQAADYPELGRAVVRLGIGLTVHIEDSADGRALAVAFAEAVQMREQAERAEQAAKDLVPGNGGES